MNGGRFVVLLYHDVHPDQGFEYGAIGRSATMYHVAEGAFLRQLRLIEHCGVPVIGLEALREQLANPQDSTRAPGVALSFDDGWQGAVERAAPILAERGMPAFFFITTEFVGRPLFTTSGALQRLDPRLFTVGSHGVTHRMMSSLSTSEIRRELVESKAQLEDLLGRAVTALSVPGGAADRRVLTLAEEVGYTEIFTSAMGDNPTNLGRRNIARIAVRSSTDDTTIRRWLARRFARERLRTGMLAVPKRLLGRRVYSQLRRLLLGEGRDHQHLFEP